MERVERQRQIAMTKLAGVTLVGNLDGLQLFEDERKISDDDIGAQGVGGLDTLDESLCGLARYAAQGMQFLGGGEPSDEANRERTGAVRSEERRVGKECRSRWSP